MDEPDLVRALIARSPQPWTRDADATLHQRHHQPPILPIRQRNPPIVRLGDLPRERQPEPVPLRFVE